MMQTFNGGDEIPYGITQVQALQVPDKNVSNRKVCVIDSGYDLNHPDLPKDSVTGEATSSAGNWFQDGSSHGTHVAGTIAAIGNNGIGVTGVV